MTEQMSLSFGGRGNGGSLSLMCYVTTKRKKNLIPYILL